ncbi:hypothetical protein M7I_6758 [Glarea lozoyensis 74030]|uniref:Uncharacterized protein n=1 Tax=Glarea lozoyensis (strain ATCC 74030 / MF5533) TaxID=1104152 RepID=H0EVG0_GLAL7|nr:hypothetical protein M7I_6758 [Glarea lozoyensis 74030]
MHTITFNLITPSDAPRIAEGTIMFLPPHDQIPAGTYTDPSMNIGAYNHPIVILSCPKSPLRLDSKVEIAIMTSFHGTSIRTHLASKGIVTATGAEAAAKAGYLRVVTASKPHALGTLKLRNGKGMKRDCSYVGLRNTYTIALGALARYGGVREEVDAYRLTAHALRVLVGGIEERRGREGKTVRRRSVGAEKEKVEKERKDRIVREIEREVLSSTTVGARDEDIVMTERRKSVGNIVKGRAQDLIKEIPKEFLSPTALRARAREEKKRAAMEPRRRSLENSYGIVEKENKGDPEEELKSKKDSLNRDVLMGQLKFKQQRKGIEQKKTSRREKPKTQKEVHKLLKAKSQKLQERQELHRSAEEKLKLSKQRKLAEQEKLAKHVKANKLKKEQEEKHILGQQKLQEQKKQQQKLKQEEKLKQQKKAEEKQRVVEQQRLKKQRKIHQKTRVIEKKKVKEQRILKKEKKLKQGKKKVQLNRKKAKKL